MGKTPDTQANKQHSPDETIFIENDTLATNDACSASGNDHIRSERRFPGVVRNRVKTYVINGIDLDSTEEGLCDFLHDLGVHFKAATFIYTRRTDYRLVRVVVDANDANIIEDQDNWPEGKHCRPWLKVADYRSRQRNFNDDPTHE